MPKPKRRKTAAEIAEARSNQYRRAEKGIMEPTPQEIGNAVGRRMAPAGAGTARAAAKGTSLFFDALKKQKKGKAGNPFK